MSALTRLREGHHSTGEYECTETKMSTSASPPRREPSPKIFKSQTWLGYRKVAVKRIAGQTMKSALSARLPEGHHSRGAQSPRQEQTYRRPGYQKVTITQASTSASSRWSQGVHYRPDKLEGNVGQAIRRLPAILFSLIPAINIQQHTSLVPHKLRGLENFPLKVGLAMLPPPLTEQSPTFSWLIICMAPLRMQTFLMSPAPPAAIVWSFQDSGKCVAFNIRCFVINKFFVALLLV